MSLLLAARAVEIVEELEPGYYIDPLNGNNAQSGLAPDQAWQTIGKWVNEAPADSLAYLMSGSYPAVNFGTPLGAWRTAPARLRPYPGATITTADPWFVPEGWSSSAWAGGTLGRCDQIRLENLFLPGTKLSLRGSDVELVGCRFREVELYETNEDILIDQCDLGGYTSLSQQSNGVWFAGDNSRPRLKRITVKRSMIGNCTRTLVRPANCEDVLFEDLRLGPVIRTTAVDSKGIRIHPDGAKFFGGGDRITFRRCFMFDVEGACFLVKDADGSAYNDILLENFAVVRPVSPYEALDIQQGTNIDIVNSTFLGGTASIAGGNNIRLMNSIFYKLVQTAGNITYRKANLLGVHAGALAANGDEIAGQATFVDPDADDYRLAPGSLGIGAGLASDLDLTAPTDDVFERIRSGAIDLGAFQG